MSDSNTEKKNAFLNELRALLEKHNAGISCSATDENGFESQISIHVDGVEWNGDNDIAVYTTNTEFYQEK